jgi:hypothetical protein
MKTIHLVMLPVVFSLLPFIIIVIMGSAGYIDTPIQRFLLILTFFLLGFMGLPMIVRKETPWFITLKGWVAIVQGVVLMLIWWGIDIGFVILMLSKR